ncbi:MAG: MFS transporter [Clostridia bacterium]|nr:MFS transporter [Clostridia bacterium]
MQNQKHIMRGTGVIFIITYLAYTSIYISRLNLSIAAPKLTELGIMDEAQIGLLGSIFSVVFAIGRLLNGVLNDKLTPWIMLCTGLVAVGLSNIVSGVFMSFAVMAVLWGINAYAQSMLWGSVLRAMSSVYDPDKASKRTAIMVSSVAVGNLLGILVNTWIISLTGRIELAFIIPGALNLVMTPLTFIALKKIPFEPAKGKRSILPINLLKDKSIRTMLVPAFCHGVMKDNISLWMAAFFVTVHSIDLKSSSWFLLFIPAIGLLGRMSYSFVYQLCGKDENKVSFFGFIVCGISAAALCLPFKHPVLSMVCLGIIYAAVSVINTSILSIYPLTFAKSGNIATVSGLMDFGVYFAAGVGSAIYGVVISNFGYLAMFLSWIALSLLSLFFLPRQK